MRSEFVLLVDLVLSTRLIDAVQNYRNIHETLGTAESAQSALYLADFPTDEPNPNGEISKLLPYRTIYAGACGTIRCILYTRHLPQIVGLTRTVGLVLILGRSLRIIKCSSF